MIVKELKKSILNYAIKGMLSKQNIYEKCNIYDIDSIKNADLFPIPNNWKWLKVKNIGNLIRGNGIKKSETTNHGIHCIRYGEIYTNYSYSFCEAISYVPKNIAKKCKKVVKGDVLLTLTGENEYDIAKATAYLGNDILVAGGDLAILTNHNQNPLYLSYFFASPFAIIQKAKSAKGNIIVHTSTDKIGDYFIPIPPLEEQQRIVDKIEELFVKLNEINFIEEELITIKKQFPIEIKKSILNDLFSGNASFINEKYDTWTSDILTNIADIYTGDSIPEALKKNKYTAVEEGYNYIATKDLSFEHTFNYNNGVKIPYSEISFKHANPNDILMCIEGGSAGKKIGILTETVCYGNKLCKFSLKTDSIIPKFLYYYLQSEVFLKNFYENLNGIIGGVSIRKIRKIRMKFPSITEQQRIVERIEQLLSLCGDIDKIVNQ